MPTPKIYNNIKKLISKNNKKDKKKLFKLRDFLKNELEAEFIFNKYIRQIKASNISISTSGGYERYFLVNGRKYSHIIDPRTGFPVNHLSSVTVVSQSQLFADALSTAL